LMSPVMRGFPIYCFLASTISARSDRTIAIILVLHLRQQADLRCETG
jgi:hypothetical protein